MNIKGRAFVVLVVLAIAGVWAYRLIQKPVPASPPEHFALVYEPIGVAAAGGRLLVTTYCEHPKEIQVLDASGESALFARLPDVPRTGCNEDYITVSPGLGGFPPGQIYVKQGGRILAISPDGKSISEFASLPTGDTIHGGGITFDRIGTFGYDMIISSREGRIWRIDSTGKTALIVSRLKAGAADPPPDPGHAALEPGEAGLSTNITENVAVAPHTLKPFGGHILVASETNNTIYAVGPDHRVRIATQWPRAEGVYFIPPRVCTLPGSGAGFFAAAFTTNQIIKAPPGDFRNRGGQALVVSEVGTIGLLTSDGEKIRPTPIHTGRWGQLKGATFISCPQPA